MKSIAPQAELARRTGRAGGRLAPIVLALVVLVAPIAGTAAAGTANVGGAGTVHATASTVSGAAATAPGLTLSGRGFGHGRGMGQYGALGSALAGLDYHQILDHFYGGTVPGVVAATSPMTVDMSGRDGLDTIVVQEQGLLAAPGVTCAAGSPCGVRIVRQGPRRWQVQTGTGCAGGPAGWKVSAADVSAPSIAVIATANAGDDRRTMLQLCEATGSRWLRGDLWAVDTGTSQATVNHVDLASYVRGVVPDEAPAAWGSLGGGAGEQALLAQAVASRSYAVAEHRWPYAKTCDSTACQVYGGRAFQIYGGAFTDLEGTALFAASDGAAERTAGEVRVFGAGGTGPTGSVARTEFSSSSGGFSAGGTFPAVADAGDATPTNPNHFWTTDVAASDVQAAFGAGLGALVSVAVTARNGLGDLGGRVTTMSLHFAGGDVATTGPAFAAALDLRSDWFAVTAQALPGPPSPGATPPTHPIAAGYHTLGADGSVSAFGGAPRYGSVAGAPPHAPAVSIAERAGGYWVLTAEGTIHGFGAAGALGGLQAQSLNAPPFQVAATPDGGGYWIVAFDGGVFSFGDAAFHGSTGALKLNQPIVGMAPTPSGKGYWLVAADGGVFSFGDARFAGSTGNIHLNQPVVAMGATADGGGYWLIAADGGVFTFGTARFRNSLPGIGVHEQAVALAPTADGGYLVATSAGHVYGFATIAGGGPATPATGPVTPTVALATAR